MWLLPLSRLPGPGGVQATQRVWKVYRGVLLDPLCPHNGQREGGGSDPERQEPFLTPSMTSQGREAATNLQVKRQGASGGVRYRCVGG